VTVRRPFLRRRPRLRALPRHRAPRGLRAAVRAPCCARVGVGGVFGARASRRARGV